MGLVSVHALADEDIGAKHAGLGPPSLDSIARLAAAAFGMPHAVLFTIGEGGAALAGATPGAPADAAAAVVAGVGAGTAPPAPRVAAGLHVSARSLGHDLVVLLLGPRPFASAPADDALFAAISDAAAQVSAAHALDSRVKELEESLSRATIRFREFSETVASGIALVGLDGRIEEINGIAATILAVDPTDAIGRPFRDFVAPEDLDGALTEFRMRLGGDLTRRETEIHVLRPSGERRLLQICSSTISADDGVAGVCFAARDITEEREREAQHRRAERLASIAPLLSGVCHELNNPLTSIKSFAELLLLDPRSPDDREAIEIVRREADRAARIVTDLRLVARQTQEDGGNAAALDINEIVRDVIRGTQPDAEATGVEMAVQLEKRLPAVLGVRSQIERVVSQLVGNAIHALQDHEGKRRVSVRTSGSDTGVALRVEDTGPGIALEHVDRIFDPFWTNRSAGDGTGLGLSLVHGIVSDHGGAIRVDGGWGRGASFTVELPVPTEPPAPVREAPVRESNRRPLRILVVDDEGPIRFSLMRYMERRGHQVTQAEEGLKALQLVESAAEPYDIIVADLRMPSLGGVALYARLKERGEGLEQRLIFITGDAESPDAARGLEEAGVPVVLKPFELAEIAQIIEAQADVLGVRVQPSDG